MGVGLVILPDGEINVVAEGGEPIKNVKLSLQGPKPTIFLALTFQVCVPLFIRDAGVIEQFNSPFAQFVS